MSFRLKHNDGHNHLNSYWIDDEFCVRYWDSKEEADKFAALQKQSGFNLLVEEVDENA